MSLKAICQVILYLESFKNVNLQEQGVYMIRARIKADDVYAPPHRNFETNIQLRSRKKNKIRDEADIQDNQYKSKSFLIKYNDEEIDLEEIAVFRLELQTMPLAPSSGVYLHLDLYFAVDDTDSIQGQRKQFNYEKVDSIKLKLNNIDKGICCYVTPDFNDDYRSTLKLHVLSMLVDIKFRTWKLFRKQKSQHPTERQKICSVKQYFDFYLKRTNQGQSGFYRKYVKYIIQFSQNAKKNIVKHLYSQIDYKPKLPKYCLVGGEKQKQKILDLVEVQPKVFMQYMNMYKIQNYSAKMFQDELQKISSQTHLFFQIILQHLEQGDLNKNMLKQRYSQFSKQRFGEFIFQNKIKQDQLSGEKCSVKEKIALAKKIRNKKHFYDNLEPYDIEEDETVLSEHPIFIHEVTEMNKPEKIEQKDVRNQLIILEHGFQGSSYDMMNIKNILKTCRPKSKILNARCNQGATNGDIGAMGELLAQQIQEFIDQQSPGQSFVLHFVGHSLGGIIMRASLKYLNKYRNSFGTFMTFSSPHLSYLNGTKTSIETGLWVIKKWKKIVAIDQMTMSDHKNLQQTFMYKLSKEGCLKDFKRVVLISSPQDSYVPWHSARIHRSSNQKDQSVSLQNKMTNNILQSDKIQKIHRISVDFYFSQRNIDHVIGRAAHIKFLSDKKVLKMMFSCLPELFQ